MLSSTLTLLALGAAGASAAAIGAPAENITQMKRNIIKRNSLTQGGEFASHSLLSQLRSLTSSPPAADDATILSFALILEHLEDTFYSEALQKFDDAAFTQAGYPGVYAVLQQVAKDEHAHVEFLTAGLKAAGVEQPPLACDYSFPYTDVKSFLALSQVVEGLGTLKLSSSTRPFQNLLIRSSSSVYRSVRLPWCRCGHRKPRLFDRGWLDPYGRGSTQRFRQACKLVPGSFPPFRSLFLYF